MAKVGTEVVTRSMGHGAQGAECVPASAADPFPVAVISGSAAGTEYTEDAVAPANPVGGMGMGVAITTPANEVPDADVVASRMTRKGEAHSKNVDLEALLTAIFGAASGAAIITDIDGTIQRYIRGLVVQAALQVASLSVMDDWDESDRAKVNLIAGVAGITAGAGAVAAGTPRVTLASDDPLVAKLPALGPKASSGSVSVANSFLTAAALGDGSVNTAEDITVANTVQLIEFFNLSANVIWASWTGTAAASTTGSFPIPALASGVAGYYSAPPGASGTLSIIAVGGASAFTCIGWS